MQKQVEKKKYYVVRERAVPEVLLKVVEAKRLLESKRVATVQEAATQKEKALSQGPKPTDPKVDSKKEPEETEEEEEILDPVDFGDNYEDEAILADLFAKISPLAGILAVAIIFMVCVIVRVLA